MCSPFFSTAVSLLLVCLVTASTSTLASAQATVEASAERAGSDPAGSAASSPNIPVDRVNALIGQAIAEGQMPGAVVAVADQRRLLFAKAYGHRQLQPKPVAMTFDTVFDLASLTKPVATASSVMALVDDGHLDLNAPAARYLPEFAAGGKSKITVTDLMLHQSGLIADNSLSDYADGADTAWRRICELEPVAPPGERFIYSDVGYIVLGKLVERLSGSSLAQFSHATASGWWAKCTIPVPTGSAASRDTPGCFPRPATWFASANGCSSRLPRVQNPPTPPAFYPQRRSAR